MSNPECARERIAGDTVGSSPRETRTSGAPSKRPGGAASASPCVRDLAGPLLVSLLGGDEPKAEEVFRTARERGADTAVIVRDVVGPALCDVGAMWSRGEVSVAEEHLASSMVARILARDAGRVATPPVGAPRVLFACLAGEFHDLGLRLACDVAREAGWDAECLGGNVPRTALVSFVAQRTPRVLALSVALTAHVPECARTVAEVREAAPGTEVLVGGHAFSVNPDLVRLSGADAYVPCTVALRDWLRSRTRAAGRGGEGSNGLAHALPAGLPPELPASLRRKIARKAAR